MKVSWSNIRRRSFSICIATIRTRPAYKLTESGPGPTSATTRDEVNLVGDTFLCGCEDYQNGFF